MIQPGKFVANWINEYRRANRKANDRAYKHEMKRAGVNEIHYWPEGRQAWRRRLLKREGRMVLVRQSGGLLDRENELMERVNWVHNDGTGRTIAGERCITIWSEIDWLLHFSSHPQLQIETEHRIAGFLCARWRRRGILFYFFLKSS